MVHLPEALRHAIEGARQLSDLVTARHGKRLGEGTVGQLGRGDREPAERAREVHGQEARGSERCGQAREERSEHGIPGVPLELPSLALGLFERAVGGAQHPIEVGLGAVDREAPLGVESGSHRGQAAIGREGNQRFLILPPLLVGAEEGAQEIELLGHPRRAFVPGSLGSRRACRPGVHRSPGKSAQLFAQGGAHSQGRQGLGRDAPVDIDQPADRHQAPGGNGNQREDHERRCHEDLVGETHGVSPT